MIVLSLSLSLLLPQEPMRIGVIASEAADGGDVAFLRGARYAVEATNRDGVNGGKVELRIVPATNPAEVAAVVGRMQAEGVVAVVAPKAEWLAAAARKACAGKLPCVAFTTGPSEYLPLLDRVLQHNFCMTKVALVRDRTKEAVELGKTLAKGSALAAPVTLLWELDITSAPKVVEKQFEKGRPELLLFDAEPPLVAKFLREMLATDPIPIVLTPRSHDDSLRTEARRLFVLQGQSAASASTTGAFRSDYERDHGTPGHGAAEGHEGVMAVVAAARAGKGNDAAAITAGLPSVTVDGVRGRHAFEPARGAFVPPVGMWIVEAGVPQPYVPGIVALQEKGASAGTDTTPERPPQQGIGEPFGKWRTRQFVLEEGAQWVVCGWAADTGFATIDADLQQLGLSTGGVDPLVDHLVKEEILARVLAITSTKFGRKEDGTGIEGKSLRISFGVHVAPKEREKKKQRLWPALFGGDHADAGGQAFGTYCRVYSSFIRRTIFQAHALQPAVTTADREYLDGTYAFSSDYAKDKRSELIRALINGYAGSMALTLAHEVGHLAGLDHVTDDPAEIMNVNEGAGLDYRDAHFGPGTWAIMQDRYGLVGDKPGKKR
jgi:hypothetical protein